MSGHSKWSTIKHKKAATDQKRANIFSKMARAITVAARQGGGDLETNYELRSVAEKAKSLNMPKDNIERAIKKGTGELGGEQLEELLMEAYGPGGAALLIEAVTDNRNRTTGDIRNLVIKAGGKMAGEGSVRWLFDHLLVVAIPSSSIAAIDELELFAIELGAEDIRGDEEGVRILFTPQNPNALLAALKDKGYVEAETSVSWVAKDEIDIADEDIRRLENLVEGLDDHDDVQEIYTNIS